MKFRKALSLLLSLAVIFGTVMPGTLATAAEDDIVIETTAPEETTQPTTAPIETSTGDAEGTTPPAETTDPTTEPSTEPENAGCTECGQVDGHAETCSQYVVPAVEAKPENTPQVGDTIWIKSGSKTYKQADESSAMREVWFIHETKIVSIVLDDNGDAAWYEFEPTGALKIFSDYKYVRVESTSTGELVETEPANEHTCNCGENAPENLANHADSCPRKQYIKTLYEDKTAKEIYAVWNTYDESTQKDILDMLKAYVPTRYDQLMELIDEKKPATEQEVNGNTFTTTTAVTVENTNSDKIQAIKSSASFIDSERNYYCYDIQGEDGAQTKVTVSGLLSSNRKVSVVVMHLLDSADAIATAKNSGMGVDYFEVADSSCFPAETAAAKEFNGTDNRVYYVNLGTEIAADGTVSFTTDSFSTFIYVVTFAYEGYSYELDGGGSMYLSDLMEGLGLDRTVSEVSGVSFSDSSLVTVEKDRNDWLLTSKESFSTKEFLTITFTDGTSVTIKVTDPVLKYYLNNSTNWNMGTTSISLTKNGATAAMGNYTTNSSVVTKDELANAADSSNETVDMIIYARPGMALRFAIGTTWRDGTFDLTESNNGEYKYHYWWVSDANCSSNYWEWVWDGSDNYVILDNNTSVDYVDINIIANGKTCNVRIYVIPANTEGSNNPSNPSKVKDTLKSDSKYSVVAIPATLYNYDGKQFNNYYNGQNNGYFLQFSGRSKGEYAQTTEIINSVKWTGTNLPNSGNNSTGIYKDRLGDDNLPVMTTTAQTQFFTTDSSITAAAGTTVYENVGFEFIYDSTTGNYTYRSNLNHAQYNANENLIELYNQSLGPCIGSSGSNNKGGFYPFVDINSAIKNYAAEDSGWQSNLGTDTSWHTAQYVADLVATTSDKSTVDMHYGLQVAADFYMPADRKSQVNGADLVYNFVGDDDLWVYVDDQLVLDLGGAHPPLSGSINFTQQTVTLGQYHNVTASGNEYTLGESGNNKTYTFEDLGINIDADQMHTLRIFYLERWSGESNCQMQFNLPLAPANSVMVSKTLTNQDGDDLSVTPDVDYTFQVFTATDNDDALNKDDSEFKALANTSYTIQGSDQTYTTDSEGKFKLKAGQTAVFENIGRFTEVYAIEIEPNDGYVYSGYTVSVNNGSATAYTTGKKTETVIMKLNQSISFKFTNKMQTQPLTIKKEVVGGADGLIEPNQKFNFTLSFTKFILETGKNAIKANNGVALTNRKGFELGQEESITIPRVPVNMTFTLGEKKPATNGDSFDAPVFAYETVTVSGTPNAFDTDYAWTVGKNGENKITVTNQQRFSLIIKKDGFSQTDENQTALFKIKGPDNFEMIVTVVGNNSTTITKLPVGKYTITELTDWSWRYELNKVTLDGDKISNGLMDPISFKPTKVQTDAAFTNKRDKDKWLSGDCYAENWWGDSNSVKRKDED